MKNVFILCLVCLQSVFANSLDEYFSCLKQLNQPNGNFREGEIEVVTDPTEITRVQKIQEERLLKKGFSSSSAAEFSRIGIVSEDQYWIWLRDAVFFPKGIPGTYDRLIWKSELKGGPNGVAVLPILPSGKIVLNLNYRHATRSWELELPRGGIQPLETPQAAATREVKEETGLISESVIFLGNMTPDTGALSSVIPIFIGKISAKQDSSPEYSEAISDIIAFTKDELKEGLIRGYVEVPVGGKQKRVPLRDSFLTFALFQAEIRKLI